MSGFAATAQQIVEVRGFERPELEELAFENGLQIEGLIARYSSPHHRPGDLPRFALVGGPATQLTSHAESTVMKTNASFDAHA